jgi:hypothetical protein
MLRPGVEPGQKPPGLFRDDRRLVILAGELADRIHRVEPQDGHELDALRDVALQKVLAGQSPDSPAGDAGQDLGSQEIFVGRRVLAARPAVPDAGDPVRAQNETRTAARKTRGSERPVTLPYSGLF